MNNKTLDGTTNASGRQAWVDAILGFGLDTDSDGLSDLDELTADLGPLASDSDLNTLGEYSFRMIHPVSVGAAACHTIRAYQDGVYLGEATYNGYLMPLEE